MNSTLLFLSLFLSHFEDDANHAYFLQDNLLLPHLLRRRPT